LRARTYNPATGRFLQSDPVMGSPADPRTLHHYAYAFNNPVNYTDASGLMPEIGSIYRSNHQNLAVLGLSGSYAVHSSTQIAYPTLPQRGSFNSAYLGQPGNAFIGSPERSTNGPSGQYWQNQSDPQPRQQSEGFRQGPCGIGSLLVSIRDWGQVGMQIFKELRQDFMRQLRNPQPRLTLTCGVFAAACLVSNLHSPTLERLKAKLWYEVIGPRLALAVKEITKLLDSQYLTPALTEIVMGPLTGAAFGLNYAAQGVSSLLRGQGWQADVGRAWAEARATTAPVRNLVQRAITEIGPIKLIAGTVLIGAALVVIGGAALPAILAGAALGGGLAYGGQVWSNYQNGARGWEVLKPGNGWDIARGVFGGAMETAGFALAGVALAGVGAAAKTGLGRLGGWVGSKLGGLADDLAGLIERGAGRLGGFGDKLAGLVERGVGRLGGFADDLTNLVNRGVGRLGGFVDDLSKGVNRILEPGSITNSLKALGSRLGGNLHSGWNRVSRVGLRLLDDFEGGLGRISNLGGRLRNLPLTASCGWCGIAEGAGWGTVGGFTLDATRQVYMNVQNHGANFSEWNINSRDLALATLTGMALGGSVGVRQMLKQESYLRALGVVSAGVASNLVATWAGSNENTQWSDFYFAAAFGGISSPITGASENTFPWRTVANASVAASLNTSQYIFSEAYKGSNISSEQGLAYAFSGGVAGIFTPLGSRVFHLNPNLDDFVATPIGTFIGGAFLPQQIEEFRNWINGR
ncbi:MAG: hypothetical protein DPW09_38435, partial [Anaerolineae bacterium]|nr:hypothetical protein [Anaerolineae bacterium]